MKQSNHSRVFLFLAVFGRDPCLFEKVAFIMERKFGRVSRRSKLFDFTHTDYYTDEMGKELKKMFFIFDKPIPPEKLVDIKLHAIKIESKFSIKRDVELNRQVNLDPGYISLSKVVLATTKNYSHRLYLGKGIYGEVTLFFKDNTFTPFPWTYPDYRTSEYIDFFNETRKICYNK